MANRPTNTIDSIDGKTSRSICNAVGERLQQSIRPEFSNLPDQLRHLMDELRRRDARSSEQQRY
jgi:hypothetical protein